MIVAQSMYKWWILLNPVHLTDLVALPLCLVLCMMKVCWNKQKTGDILRIITEHSQSSYSFMECLEFDIELFFLPFKNKAQVA